MKHRRSFGVAALVAGVAVLGGGQGFLRAQGVLAADREMYLAAMSEMRHPQGYIGGETRDVSEDAGGALRLKDAHGVEVTNLDHDGPACKAGIKVHDVILQINGQGIDGEEQLRHLL